MGLDMYMFARSQKLFGTRYDRWDDEKENLRSIGYWRKAYDVQETIIEYVYDQIGPNGDNCVYFKLGEEAITEILETAKNQIELIEERIEDGEELEDDRWNLDDWKSTKEYFNEALVIKGRDP